MVLHTWTDGNVLYSVDLLGDFQDLFTLKGLDAIKQLIDRAGVWSAGMIDGWGDAYIDSNGRENSVSSATALFTNNRYHTDFETTGAAEGAELGTDNDNNPSDLDIAVTVTAPAIVTSVQIYNSSGAGNASVYIKKDGITIASKTTVDFPAGGFITIPLTLSDYIDAFESTSTNIINIETSSSPAIACKNVHAGYSGTLFNLASQILPVDCTGNEIELTEVTPTGDTNIITHDIPAGTFSTTISNAIGVPLIEDWETGADIDYKLTGTGGAEDSGWLDCSNSPEISSFTAFTDEPDTLIVRLTPKGTTPTIGFPSIKGFWVRAT